MTARKSRTRRNTFAAAEAQLYQALAAAGQALDTAIRYNAWNRYGGKSDPSWLIAYTVGTDHIGAVFGDWRQGSRHEFKSWLQDDLQVTGDDAEALERALAEQRKEAEARAERKARFAAQLAAGIVEHCPREGASPYLTRKGVGAYGVHFGQDEAGAFLAVPMVDLGSGELKSVQRIDEAGDKRYLPGTPFRSNALCHPIGADLERLTADKRLWLAEGYATAATIHELTGEPVLVAFDAGNLARVATAAVERWPGIRLAIAADNDQWAVGRPIDPAKPRGKKKTNTGVNAARKAAQTTGARVVVPDFTGLVDPDQAKASGDGPTDFNDLLHLAGSDATRRQLLAEASEPASLSLFDDDGRRKSQATLLIEIGQQAELFHDPDGEPYALLDIDGRREVWPLKSPSVREWLQRGFYRTTGKGAGAQGLQDALDTLSAKARFDGQERGIHIRVAAPGSNHDPIERILIDLGDKAWRCIEVTAEGWRVLNRAPVMLTRPPKTLPLPEPVRTGDGLEAFQELFGLSNDNLRLLVAWLLAALRGRGPYPLLVLQAEQGSGKSTLAKAVKALSDPAGNPLRSPPKDEDDLTTAARNSWVLSLDNLSGLSPVLSDTLCRIATGGSVSKRKLYTNDDEHCVEITRPVLLNGIDDIATRPDLADRALIVGLDPIPEHQRRTERDLWQDFERIRAAVFAELLDALAAAVANVDRIPKPPLPRMADFAVWVMAAEPALGWPPGAFLELYRREIAAQTETILEASPFGSELLRMIRARKVWSGTSSELLREVNLQADVNLSRSKAWPASPRGVSSAVRRLAPALRRCGVTVDFARAGHGGPRMVYLESLGKRPSPPSPEGFDYPARPAAARVSHGDGYGGGGDDVPSPLEHTVTTPSPEPSPRKASSGAGFQGNGDGGDGGDGLSGRFSKTPAFVQT